ncbi:MAG: MFS transporter [Proteobacteria bacterium]|nr:MFS transporter [Pseudomonadota bacterium]
MTQAVPYWRLSAFYFAYFAYVGAFSPYFSLYLQHLGLGAFAISVLLALQQMMRMLGPNFWGRMADASGARLKLLRLSMLLMAASFCCLLFAQSFAGLFAVMALMSFFGSAAMPLQESMTFVWLSDAPDRYGPIRLWGSVGFIIAVLVLGAILDFVAIDWLLWLTLPLIVAMIACAFVLPQPAATATRQTREPLWPVLRRPEVWALLLSCFLMAVAHGPLYTFYSIYLVDHGYGKSTIGILWSLGVVAEIAVFLFMPRLLRRWTFSAILAASYLCAVARFLMTGWAVESVLIMALAQILHAATFGAHHVAAVGLINTWFRGGRQVGGQALYLSLSFGAGGMVGGLASGLLWEHAGAAVTFSLAAMCAFAGFLLIAWQGANFPRHSRSTD